MKALQALLRQYARSNNVRTYGKQVEAVIPGKGLNCGTFVRERLAAGYWVKVQPDHIAVYLRK